MTPAPAEGPNSSRIPNFHKVDERLFRGGQPASTDLAALKALGVRTVLNLRHERPLIDAERADAEAAGLQYFSVPMQGLASPTSEQLSSALRILDDPQNWPVFVHCKRGADRTGAVVACYRIAHQKWTADAAIREADDLGMLGIEFAKRALIRDFYAKLGTGAEPATVTAGETVSAEAAGSARAAAQ